MIGLSAVRTIRKTPAEPRSTVVGAISNVWAEDATLRTRNNPARVTEAGMYPVDARRGPPSSTVSRSRGKSRSLPGRLVGIRRRHRGKFKFVQQTLDLTSHSP